jgi:hypothetical protein
MEETMKSPITLLSALLDDFKRLEPDVMHLDRDLKTIEARYEHEGYGFLTVTLPTLCDALDQGIASGRFTCPTAFAKSRSEALPKFLSGLLCKVFDSQTGLLKENPRIGLLKCLREILRLFKKLPLSGERDILLDRAARNEFRQCDESIASVKFDARHVHHLAGVCRVTLNQLEGADYEQLHYKHGPGAVRESLSANQKWRAVDNARGTSYQEYWDPLLDLLDSSRYRDSRQGQLSYVEDVYCQGGSADLYEAGRVFSEQYAEVPNAGLALGRGDAGLSGEESEKSDQASKAPVVGDISKLITVPKTSTARRTITSEPCLRQYAQQGLNELLRSNIQRCKVLSNCLDLTDQSSSQKLALEGSRTGVWSTIDLSSASDLLSFQLVKLVFGSKPSFLERLVESRSPYVADGKTVYPMRKYAGMGNATTFPVQSVVFASIAIAAILDAEGLSPSTGRGVRVSEPLDNPIIRASRLVRVYGDDIIVPTVYARQVVDWISAFGLRVNYRKSFTNSTAGKPCFREACGVDAYGGFDITPLYLRADPTITSPEPSAIASLVSASNSFWMRGLYKASATLAQSVEELLKRKLPLVPAKSSALGWHSRLDACNPTKWDPLAQRLVLRAPVLKPVYRPDRLDGFAALLKFFSVPLLGRGPRHLERTQVRFNTNLRWKWIPAECG